ncbi:MAG: hypothetical protein EOO56_07730 [Hymenobacter sp.]|nr:MAG: hypothetical protein EOO56_07730 [Hymenobacter sp.]
MVGQQPEPLPQVKIIVDTNIIFSALLNSNGSIGALLFNSGTHLEFYSCAYMRQEITRHWPKLQKISKLSAAELQEAYEKLLLRIRFIHEGLIPTAIWEQAEQTVQGIDPDDIAFVALTQYLQGALWTGDKVLYDGLKARQFDTVWLTADLLAYRAQLG